MTAMQHFRDLFALLWRLESDGEPFGVSIVDGGSGENNWRGQVGEESDDLIVGELGWDVGD